METSLAMMAVTRTGDDRGRGRVPGREQKSGLRARSVGRRKTKERLRNPSQPYCVHPRSKSFLLSSAGFIRGPKPWQSPIRCPLSSLRAPAALRMQLNSLILSLVLTWASFRSARAMPTSKVVVELSACGMTPESSNVLLSKQVGNPRICSVINHPNCDAFSARQSVKQS